LKEGFEMMKDYFIWFNLLPNILNHIEILVVVSGIAWDFGYDKHKKPKPNPT
jgi:hypothetical protein